MEADDDSKAVGSGLNTSDNRTILRDFYFRHQSRLFL